MEVLLALVVGVVFGAGIHLLLQRDFFRAVLGISLLSTSVNLVVFVAGGLTRAAAPILAADGNPVVVADPLPQALVLTAIVIGFGLFGFTVALALRKRRTLGALAEETPPPVELHPRSKRFTADGDPMSVAGCDR